MKKIKFKMIWVLLSIFIIPSYVSATTSSSGVISNEDNENVCTSYNDPIISTNGDVFVSRCKVAKCNGIQYEYSYYSNNAVNCTNGNSNPYKHVINTGCDYGKVVCSEGTKYCSEVVEYDCSRMTNGDSYSTPTTTKKITNYRPTATTTTTTTTTTTVPTTTVAPSNTKLKTLSLSTGVLNFSPDTYSYNLSIASNVNSIRVNAVPEDSKSKVSVSGYENLVDGSVISVIVLGVDGNTSEYKISIKKEAKLSNNAKLKSLTIKGYDISFHSTTNEYNITIEEGITALDIDCITEDESAIAIVDNNAKLENKSKINIEVTAQDGTKNIYTINVFVKKKSNFLKILFILILILAVVAGGYYIYKKFIGGKSGEKYDYE